MAPCDAKSFAKKQAKQEDQRKKLREKLADPAYRAAQRAKQRAAQDRRVAKMKAQHSDPEYQREQAEKRLLALEKQRQKAAVSKPKAPPVRRASKPANARGMKGRTPTADERRIMDAIGRLPCICCTLRGRTNPVISLHHTDGRVKPDAHKKVLPLCSGHHDTPVDKGVLEQYPDMVPFHAKGALGGPGAWRAEFGHERELLVRCYELAGLPPQAFMEY
ncbi:hypothetical protein ABKY47_002042 [Aeromonas hydrophila]